MSFQLEFIMTLILEVVFSSFRLATPEKKAKITLVVQSQNGSVLCSSKLVVLV